MSSLNDLRNFRLIKKPSIGSSSSDVSSKIAPGRKRIQRVSDSDSDDNATPKKIKVDITTKEKEERFVSLSKISSNYDTMDIQDALVRSDWSIEEAVKYLQTNCKVKNRVNNGSIISNGSSSHHSTGNHHRSSSHHHHSSHHGHSSKSGHSSRKKHRKDDYESDDEYRKNAKDAVYDSDESDSEITNFLTPQRTKVFKFLNTATLSELQQIKGCSEKKASVVLEMRPFIDWLDVVRKCNEHKSLTPEILNLSQDLLNKRSNVVNIMEKCQNMVTKLEKAISEQGGVAEQPENLNNSLKLAEYQLVGLNWLAVMHSQNMNGILADEMGLGKTIQVIAFLAYLKKRNLAKAAHLIVVPSSTLDNWECEIAKWCPDLKVEKYNGNQNERRAMRINFVKNNFKGFDIILTTYNLVSSTPEEKKMFRVCKLHYVIFDEAHMLKNMTSQRYNNLITINAERRILLTGTPLQNNLLELMSLLCFVMPSFFSKNVEDIKIMFQKKTKTDDDPSSFEESQVDRAKRIMKPFVLRRLKKDVLQFLPKKTEIIKTISMSDSQKEKYQDIVDYYSTRKVFNGVSSADIAGASIMMEMRKIANHPLLHRHYFTDEKIRTFAKKLAFTDSYKKTNPQYIFEELAVMSDFQVYQLCEKHDIENVRIPDSLIVDSGKFNMFDELLPKLKEDGHRVLVFSQFTMMLDVIEKYLTIRGYSYCRLDGSTAVNERQELINEYNANGDIFVFLLSTKAGGMGINLTAADTAIIHDIDFNPYNDKQAEDRCHRMGQTRPVTIYKFITKGSIEEGMLMIAEEKLKLEQEIHSQKDDVKEHKSMIRLLQMALGTDEKTAEILMTPSPKKLDSSSKNSKREENAGGEEENF